MRFSKEAVDPENYSLDNPCWAGMHNRRYTPEYQPNVEAFQDDVLDNTEAGQRFCNIFTPETIEAAWAKVLKVHQDHPEYYGREITVRSFERCLADALRSGLLQAPVAPAQEPEPLTPAEARQAEYEQFYAANSVQASRARAKLDVGFNRFLAQTISGEFADSKFEDGARSLNNPLDRADTYEEARPPLTQDQLDQLPDLDPLPTTTQLQLFLSLYQKASTASLRPRNGVVVFNEEHKVPWIRFQYLQDWATRAHKI
jgi:hypothetical protein